MRKRYFLRWRFLTLVLSQALALQGLLLGWGGAQAALGGHAGLGTICYGVSASRDAGEIPGKPDLHRDCLSLCAAAVSAAMPSEQASLSILSKAYTPLILARAAARIEITRTQAFLARAPPKLT